ADDERAPASLVKLMTLYLANEDIERGKAELDEPVQISHYAALTPKYRMGLRAGEWVPLHVLLEGAAIASANDAATALAERLAGDEGVFVERMNAKARELGLTGTRFTNPHGLPDPNQRSTARDLAQLTARLLEDYPASRTMLGGQTFVYNRRVYARHIPLFDDPSVVEAGRAITSDPAALSATWRQKQLEYTWLRSLMGRYEDFWAVTEAALRHAIRRLGLTASEAQVRRLMDAYLSLACFPHMPSALERLAGRPRAILSNGSPRMLEAAVRS